MCPITRRSFGKMAAAASLAASPFARAADAPIRIGFSIAQNFCLALGIYLDLQPQPVFPRWVAHFNIVTALMMAPAAFALKHTTGPLAWDGVLSFWVRVGTFGLYVLVMFFAVRATLERQAAAQVAT